MKIDALQIDGPRLWEIASGFDSERFFLGLPALLPRGTRLYLEGECMAAEVLRYLGSVEIEPELTLYPGTIAPRPMTFHLPLEPASSTKLAELASRHAEIELCDHLCAYRDGSVLLAAYDFAHSPLLVSGSIAAERIAAFCFELQIGYVSRDIEGERAD